MRKKYNINIKRRKRVVNSSKIFIVFILLFCVMGIGYSLYSTNLIINNTVNLATNVLEDELIPGTLPVDTLTVTIDQDGIVTLDGQLTTPQRFIKISNGIEVKDANLNTTSIFPGWLSGVDPIALTGEQVTNKVEILSGSFSAPVSDSFNVALRDTENTAVLNCKLADNIYQNTSTLYNDAKVLYIFIRSSVVCDNLRLKISLTRVSNLGGGDEPTVVGLNYIPGQTTFKGLTTDINQDGVININGSASAKGFLKLSDGFAGLTTITNVWANNGTVIANTGDTITFSAKVLSGTCSGTQLNACLRYKTSNTSATVINLITGLDSNNEASVTFTLTEPISVVYLYFTQDVVCSNLVLELSIDKL